MQHPWAFALAILAMAAFGFLFMWDAIVGMKRGEYKYRRAWFHKGEDGLGFWIVRGSVALVGLAILLASLWTLLRFLSRL